MHPAMTAMIKVHKRFCVSAYGCKIKPRSLRMLIDAIACKFSLSLL